MTQRPDTAAPASRMRRTSYRSHTGQGRRGPAPAIVDIAKLLGWSDEETEALVFKAIETKVGVRSRDRFWIAQARDMAVRRDEFLREKGLGQAFSDWEASRRGRTKTHRHGSTPAK